MLKSAEAAFAGVKEWWRLGYESMGPAREMHINNSLSVEGNFDDVPNGAPNLMASKIDDVVAATWIRDPRIRLRLLPRGEAMTRRGDDRLVVGRSAADRRRDQMALFESVIQSGWRRGGMREQFLDATRNSKLCGFGVIMLTFMPPMRPSADGEDVDGGVVDNLTSRAPRVVEDDLRAAVADRHFAGEPDETMFDRFVRNQRMRADDDGVGVTAEAAAGLIADSLSPLDFVFDHLVQRFSDVERSRYMAHRVRMTIAQVSARFDIPADRLRQTIPADNDARQSVNEGDQRLVDVVELHDRSRHLVWRFNPHMNCPLEYPTRPLLDGEHFFPYFLVPDSQPGDTRFPMPTAYKLVPIQRSVNKKWTKMYELVKDLAFRILYDKGRVDQKQISEMASGMDGSPFQGLRTAAGGDINSVFMAWDNMPRSVQMLDLRPEVWMMDALSGTMNPAAPGTPPTATQVAEVVGSQQRVAGTHRARLERVLGRIAERTLALSFANYDEGDIEAMSLDSSMWPVVDKDKADDFICRIRMLYRIDAYSAVHDEDERRQRMQMMQYLATSAYPLMKEYRSDQMAMSSAAIPEQLVDYLTEHQRRFIGDLLENADDALCPEDYLPPRMTSGHGLAQEEEDEAFLIRQGMIQAEDEAMAMQMEQAAASGRPAAAV